MKIGAVAKNAGIRPSAIRFYERVGVLPPVPRKNGQRHFGPEVTRQLTVIELARKAGFTIAEIKILCSSSEETKPVSMRWKELAEKKWIEMESQIERLKGMQQLLEKSTQCRCIKLDDCGRIMLAQLRQAPDARPSEHTPQRRVKRSAIRLRRSGR